MHSMLNIYFFVRVRHNPSRGDVRDMSDAAVGAGHRHRHRSQPGVPAVRVCKAVRESVHRCCEYTLPCRL